MSEKVLVTGALGFIGSRVVQEFVEKGFDVVGVDRASGEAASRCHRIELPRDAESLLKNEAPDLCIHCAGPASVPDSMAEPAVDFYGSTVVTFELLNAIRLHRPRCRVVFLSSAAVYGDPALPVSESAPLDPVSPYGFHKKQCETLCREFAKVYGLKTASVRIFSAYGPGLKRQVVWDACRKLIAGGPLALQGTGSESRDFIHVADVARGIGVVAARAPFEGEAYNLASGNETTIGRLAELLCAALGMSACTAFDGQVPAGTPLRWRADTTRLSLMGFSPAIALPDGLKETAEWCARQHVLS